MSNDLRDEIYKRMDVAGYQSYFKHALGNVSVMNSSGWAKSLCPFHDDTNESFSVNYLKEGAWKCFGCNQTGDLFTFHQKRTGHTFPQTLQYFARNLNINSNVNPEYSKQTKPKKQKKYGTLDQIYKYIDLQGKVICETVRYKDPKDFRQRRLDPKDPEKYIWNLKDIIPIPYNLGAVVKAKTVYIVEGEKDCDRLSQIDLVGTCNPMGAGKWPDSLTPYYKGKDIIILPDNDDPGRGHAQLVASKLKPVANSIHIVELPNLPPGGDISDWLSAGNTKADLLEIVKKQSSKPYEDHIDWLNKKHACITIKGKFLILNEIFDTMFNRQSISFSSVVDLQNRYLNRKIPNPEAGQKGQKKTINIVSDWLQSPDRREYEDLIFNPKGTPNGYYNIWRGFAVEPKKGDWSLMRAHIQENICNGNKIHYDWIYKWMARMVQDPGGKRPGTAIVLRGDQGVGKGVFLNQFGQIFGQHYLQINNQMHLTSRFNDHFKGIVFLFVDEGFWAGDKGSEGLLKGLITEDLIVIESKGRDAITFKNYINMAMASNNDWVVPAGLDERRFFCLDVSSAKKQNIKYFEAILYQMNNGGREAMMYDFLQYDFSTGPNIQIVPRTNALFDQILSTMPPLQTYWMEIIRRGKLHEDEVEWTGKIQKSILHSQYMVWCKNYNIRFIESPISFGKRIKRFFPPETESRYLNIGINDDGKIINKWFYEFPSLELCRQKMEKVLKMQICFDTLDVFEGNSDLVDA